MRSSNLVKIAVCLLLLSVCFSVDAFAHDWHYSSVAIVDGAGSSNTPAAFNWNETPWLHVAFTTTSEDSAYGYTWSEWLSPSGTRRMLGYASSPEDDRTYNLYMSFSDWASIQEAGTWTVRRMITRMDGQTFAGIGNTFKVNAVPEPISSALFLLGGGAIAVLKLRKKVK